MIGSLFNHESGDVINKGATYSCLHPLTHNASNRWLSARLQYLQCNGATADLHLAIEIVPTCNSLLSMWVAFMDKGQIIYLINK